MYFNQSFPDRVFHSFFGVFLTSPSNMDGAWKLEDWTPSVDPTAGWVRPTEQVAREAIELVKTSTKQIMRAPYDAQLWVNRAEGLGLLGYPELVAGDAWKAKSLCEAAIDPANEFYDKSRSDTGMQFHSGFKKRNADTWYRRVSDIRRDAYYALVRALKLTLSTAEGIFYCKQAIAEYPNDPRFPEKLRILLLQKEIRHGRITGHFTATIYPWMPENQRRRSNKTLNAASLYLQSLSDDQCAIRESTLVQRPLKSSEAQPGARKVQWIDTPSDFYGVMALKDISANTELLTDVTVTAASNIRRDNVCENCYGQIISLPFHSHAGCDARFCTETCLNLALKSYHKLTCKGKLSWVIGNNNFYKDTPPTQSLLLRFLASSVEKKTHPLENVTSAGLKGHFDGVKSSPFNLNENISSVTRMLIDLGVDVYADLRYDTWVMATLQHKVRSNTRTKAARDGGFLLAINPCVNFINHSCAPNATWSSKAGGSTVVVRTTRDVSKGEEIFISYYPANAAGGGTAGPEELERVFGEPCKCSSCETKELGF